jgi:predicted AAA+ superfamily ATPase|tara:strand:- start:116886 stop:118049 length:1164 start_codon:yes stop_codon:yes gene_type:complete
MISRPQYLEQVERAFRINSVCALLGPRQCGKTTLAKHYIKQKVDEEVHFFDLEDPEHLNAFESPKLLLQNLQGLIVIDEIQLRPALFPYIRVLVDQKPSLRLLILGSASQTLIRQSSEILSGRITYIEMKPLSLLEVGDTQTLWLRGGFPKSYLAETDENSFAWRREYIRTFLEKDIPSLGFNLNPQLIRRLWMMLTDYHGNLLNASDLGRSLDLNHKTIKHYLDILSGTFMIRQLQPWFANVSKRQVKSPKIYFRDSGLLHSLLAIHDQKHLNFSVKLGASWEGFALEQVIDVYQAEPEDCFFWATHSEAELDLLIIKDNVKYGFEFKYSSTPRSTKSMQSALSTLKLDYITVIIPGDSAYYLHEHIKVCGLDRLVKDVSFNDQPS